MALQCSTERLYYSLSCLHGDAAPPPGLLGDEVGAVDEAGGDPDAVAAADAARAGAAVLAADQQR